MKQKLPLIISILFVVFLIMLFFAYVPLQQWHYESSIDINTASFSDLYTEARNRLGIFSGFFTLDQIIITWINNSGVASLESIGFSFSHTVRLEELYDGCVISFEVDSITKSYIREEPRGFANDVFHGMNPNFNPATEQMMIDFMHSTTSQVKDWVLATIDPKITSDGRYRIFISPSDDGIAQTNQSDERGFAIR